MSNVYSAKEEARGYAINVKRIVLAYFVEAIIVITSLIGAWLFTQQYGQNDFNTMLMMMLAPVAFAVVEFCRVPLAIAIRIPSFNPFLKFIILLGLIGAAFVTVKSVSQLGEIMFRPRLYDVVHARERLTEAEANVALAKAKFGDADSLIDQRKEELATAEQNVASAIENLAKNPGQICSPISGIGRNGKPFKSLKCVPDPKNAPLKHAVDTTEANRKQAVARLAEANKQRADLDGTRTVVENNLRDERTKFRTAVMHSQLHSFTAIVYGEDPTEVSDAKLHMFLRLFVFIPAIGAAFTATIIALTAIIRVPPPPQAELAEGAEEYILEPLAQAIIQKAVSEHLNDMNNSVPRPPPRPANESRPNGSAHPENRGA